MPACSGNLSGHCSSAMHRLMREKLRTVRRLALDRILSYDKNLLYMRRSSKIDVNFFARHTRNTRYTIDTNPSTRPALCLVEDPKTQPLIRTIGGNTTSVGRLFFGVPRIYLPMFTFTLSTPAVSTKPLLLP